MSKETLKILTAVLRVFVEAVNKGNAITLHANEVTNQVCRNLHRRKEKEKKNTHGFVITALRALKGNRVVFEAVDNWDDDKLKRFKPADGKRIFGLTDPAITFINDSKMAGCAITSDQFMTDMLQEFEVLPKEPVPVSIDATPPALVEAVTEIQGETIKEMATVSVTNHNAARIAAEVSNLHYPSAYTPRRLLGALLELEAFSPDTAVVAPTIEWEPHQIQNCRDDLMKRDLIAWRKVVPVAFESRREATRYEGVYLTPLGRAVAETGKFVNDLPADKRWSRKPKHKEGIMLKDSKKTDTSLPAQAGGNIVLRLPDGTTLHCSSPREAAEAYAAFGSAITNSMPADANNGGTAIAVEPKVKTVDTSKTIATMLSAVTTAMCSTIKSLETMDGATAVNVDALSYSLTEIGHVLTGFKHYINRCLRGEATLDVKMLQDYAAQMELDVERLEKRREIHVLGDTDTGCGRVLRGSKAIRRRVWTP